MIKREQYISQIRPFINQTELVKVIVGVRRSGKSIMLELIKNELLSYGISNENFISSSQEENQSPLYIRLFRDRKWLQHKPRECSSPA